MGCNCSSMANSNRGCINWHLFTIRLHAKCLFRIDLQLGIFSEAFLQNQIWSFLERNIPNFCLLKSHWWIEALHLNYNTWCDGVRQGLSAISELITNTKINGYERCLFRYFNGNSGVVVAMTMTTTKKKKEKKKKKSPFILFWLSNHLASPLLW